jgi:hypothetical protein
MPVRLLFKCEICGRAPAPATQATLETQLQELLCGEYVDAEPERWLVWHGGGPYGPTVFACAEHRGELKAFLREHYGTLGHHPWAMGPHPIGPLRRGRAKLRERRGSAPAASPWGRQS